MIDGGEEIWQGGGMESVPPSSSPLLTRDDVRVLLEERADLQEKKQAIAISLERVNQKIAALRLLLPESVADSLLGRAGGSPPKITRDLQEGADLERVPLTEIILNALKNEDGGRSVAWVRGELLKNPQLAKRLKSAPSNLHNSLGRLKDRGQLIKRGPLYYLPLLFDRIQSGELTDERVENIVEGFSSVMTALMREYGRPFTAKDAVELGRKNAIIGEKVRKNSAPVYSWLSREVFKNKLLKDGDLYRFPSHENEAPNGDAAGASDAGEVAASPNETRTLFERTGEP